MWINCARKKHDLALFQRAISPKSVLSGLRMAPRKITQQKEAYSGVLWADLGMPTGTGRGDWLLELIRIGHFTS
jgi:hypothetical protein